MTTPPASISGKIRIVFSLVSFVIILGVAKALTILPIGDSITQGGHSGALSKPAYASYRYPLYFQLQAAGYDVNFVGPQNETYQQAYRSVDPTLYPLYSTTFDRDHAGYWGKTSSIIRSNVTTWLSGITSDQIPDIAIINVGTNDPGGSISASVFTTNLQTIVGALRTVNPNVTIILSNLMPLSSQDLAPYNTAISTFVANPVNHTPTSSIVMADIATNLPSNARYDGIHPNEIGEAYLAQVYFNAITASFVPEPAAIALFIGSVVIGTTFTIRRRARVCSSR